MKRSALLAVFFSVVLPTLASAQTWPELKLIDEHPVDNMRGGNLSGLAVCNGELWTESDRDDDQVYKLDISQRVFKAIAYPFKAPSPPDSGLSLSIKATVLAATVARGGRLDFEGITCDAAGNRYVVSEGYASVLKLPVDGSAPFWLDISPSVVAQARAAGLLQHFNAIFEGVAIDPEGNRLWLAAEHSARGLLAVRRDGTQWGCGDTCVVMHEDGLIPLPKQLSGPAFPPLPMDFSDLAFYHGKLFTLERVAHQICRRDLQHGAVEACWSFADVTLAEHRRYHTPFGVLEALVVDDKGAWLGVDNNFAVRQDGEQRPVVFRFALPKGGWDAPPQANNSK